MLARERGNSESDKSVLIPETEHRNRDRTCIIVWIIVLVIGIFFISIGIVLLFAVPHPPNTSGIQSPTEDVVSQKLSHHPPTTQILLYALIGTGGAMALLGAILSLIFCIKSQQNEYIKESLSCDQTYQSTIHNSPSRLHSFLNKGSDHVTTDTTDSAVSSRQATIHSINDVTWMKKYPRRISTGGFKLVSHKRPSLSKVTLDSNSVFNQRLQSFNRTLQDVIPEDTSSTAVTSSDSPVRENRLMTIHAEDQQQTSK